MSDFINVLRERGFIFTGGSILACQIAGEIERLRHDIDRHQNITTDQQGEIELLHSENAALRDANCKLVGAIDMIRETLRGGSVDDLLYIINKALASYRDTGPTEELDKLL